MRCGSLIATDPFSKSDSLLRRQVFKPDAFCLTGQIQSKEFAGEPRWGKTILPGKNNFS